uniref:DDE_Tnp_1_7 domain-containing protein n=1 Tax=Rhabditophanes sp. KR3021 TaxID=114890 RepID=A0AC35U059_9BILA
MLFPMFNGIDEFYCALDLCFTEIVMVPQFKFRFTCAMAEEKFKHPQTSAYRLLLVAGNIVSILNMVTTNLVESKEEVKNIFKHIGTLKGKTLAKKIHNAYLELRFNVVFDSDIFTVKSKKPLTYLALTYKFRRK